MLAASAAVARISAASVAMRVWPVARSGPVSHSVAGHRPCSRPATAVAKSGRLEWRARRFSQARRTPARRRPAVSQAEAMSPSASGASSVPVHRIRVGLSDRRAADSEAAIASASAASARRTAQPAAAKPATPGGCPSCEPAMTVRRPSRHAPASQAASWTGPVASVAPRHSTQTLWSTRERPNRAAIRRSANARPTPPPTAWTCAVARPCVHASPENAWARPVRAMSMTRRSRSGHSGSAES